MKSLTSIDEILHNQGEIRDTTQAFFDENSIAMLVLSKYSIFSRLNQHRDVVLIGVFSQSAASFSLIRRNNCERKMKER